MTYSEAIAGWERSGLKMNVWAGNLVPAPLRVPSCLLLVCKHCSCRPIFMDHSLVIFKGCPMGYRCHCQGLSDSKSGPLKLNPTMTKRDCWISTNTCMYALTNTLGVQRYSQNHIAI